MGINKMDEDEDGFIEFIAIIKWIKIFISPVLLLGVIGLAVKINAASVWMEYLGIGIICLGIICGIVFAEYVRRKYGLIEFDSSLSNTPDIDKWQNERNKKATNTNNNDKL